VAGLLIKKGEQDLSIIKAGGVIFVCGFIALALSKGTLLETGMAPQCRLPQFHFWRNPLNLINFCNGE
jgi:hypothetical protein